MRIPKRCAKKAPDSRKLSRQEELPDLFSKKIASAMEQSMHEEEAGSKVSVAAIAKTTEPRRPSPAAHAGECESPATSHHSLGSESLQDALPARMLNEFVYCPRLFFYEHVEGVFVESRDTVRGAAIHTRVDKGSGALAKAETQISAPLGEEGKAGEGSDAAGQSKPKNQNSKIEAEEIHSHSVMLGSDRLGVIAKMDLVEGTLDETGCVASVCPVDYKAGSPRTGDAGLELWDTDRMQLGLQCLVLRDNGYTCDAGIIYYRGTKQRVRLELTQELESWVISQIAAARIVAAGSIPPPLVDSPKCTRCSLAPVCLPDETRMLSIPTVEKFANEEELDCKIHSPIPSHHSASAAPPRRLMASRDEKRALYLNTPGYMVGCNDSVIKVKESRVAVKKLKPAADGSAPESGVPATTYSDRVVEEVRLIDVCHVALFGNIQVSTQAVQRFCDNDIPVTWFSMGGWFYGMTRGHSLKNVLLRIEQFRHAAEPASCLRLAQQFVRGKIHNHRVLFMRNHIEPPERVKLRLGQAREDALATRSLEELLGVEGAAAAVYFQQFSG
ncbi:MAG: CRISPR-associated endonuclease Cas1, partial [Verrucomicrobiota bacterium]